MTRAMISALVLAAALPGAAVAQELLTLTCQSLAPIAGTDVSSGAPATTEAGNDGSEAAAPAPAPLPTLPLRLAYAIDLSQTARDGAGPVTLTDTNGQPFTGVTAARTGPFAWTQGTILHTLSFDGTLGDGRSLLLLHRLDQAQETVPPQGELTKLICEVS